MTDKITVYIREQAQSGELLGVMIQDERVEGRPATLTAERGALAQTDSGPRIVMLNGTRQELDRKTHRLSVLAFDRYIIELGTSGMRPAHAGTSRRNAICPTSSSRREARPTAITAIA